MTIIRGNATDPHVVELTRETEPASVVNGRIAGTGIGYVRVAAIGPNTAAQVKSQIAELTKGGASKLIVDVRRTSSGTIDEGLALARLFVGKGTLAIREAKGGARETIAAAAGDGSVTLPTVVLIDTGTSGAVGALRVGAGRQPARRSDRRAHDRPRRVAEAGQAARRHRPLAVDDALPHARRATQLHEKGLEPTVPVDEPDVEFGAPAPTTDPILEKALERLSREESRVNRVSSSGNRYRLRLPDSQSITRLPIHPILLY